MSTPSTTSNRSWTPAQQQAIHTVGTSLLVSAAAGSGKTSVLAERCVQLLCHAETPCDVSDLLVVTFTESAAAEMKSRIAKSLSDRHHASPHPTTERHLAMLDRASIGTLHSFCSRLLRQNFHLLGIDPEFRILDADEASLLKLDVVEEMFNARYDDPDDQAFRNLIDCYGDGNDERLGRQVIKAYDTLCSVVDPPAWLNNARHKIEEAIDLPMGQSELGKAYLRLVRSDLTSMLRRCEAAGIAVNALKNFPAYVQELRDMYAILKHWLATFDSHGLDALAEEAASVEFPRLKAVPSTVEGKEIAKGHVDGVRNEMKMGSWRKNLLFTVDEWKEGLAITLPHVDLFLSLVSDFALKYTEEKDTDSQLDFSDLEQLSLRCLKVEGSNPPAPSPLARSYHQQFSHVLVDEYQDINEVQDAILSLVSRECLATTSTQLPRNFFCVGDVKQSIYRFRLAETAQFLGRRDRYQKPDGGGLVVDLQSNFRSRAPLLEVINSVFEKLMTKEAADLDYDQSQRLIAGQSFPNVNGGFVGSPIELHLVSKAAAGAADADSEEADLDQVEREATLLGKRILEMMGMADQPAKQVIDRTGGEPVARNIRFGDIVILLRAMRFKADQFAAVLRQMDIPVHTDSATGYFEATEVNDILALLHVLDNQRQDIPLAALLRGPLAGLSDVEEKLVQIRLAYQGEPPVPFHDAVQKYADEKTDDLADFLRKFRTKLQRWRQEVRQRPVAEFLWSIYDQTGYLAYVAGLSNGQQRQANLLELHDRARQFSTFNRQSLGRFLVFLEKLKRETDLGQASIASQAEDVVRIMTIHRSKGQEFPVVLLPDLGKTINLMDCQGTILLDRAAGLGLQVVDPIRQIRYPSLASTVISQRLKQQALAEELRVLYVAMTRAKEHLILVGSCTEKQSADWIAQWAGHTGPLPAAAVLNARTTLDWLGPVAGLLPDQFEMQMHTPEAIAAWAGCHAGKRELTAEQIALANQQPITPPPAMTAEAQAVIDRMTERYPHAEIANLAAAASVTSLVKKNATPSRTPLPSVALDRILPSPQFLTGASALDAADKGTATHAVLEHFDFSQGADSLEAQIQKLIDTRRLTPELAATVDLDTIRWFLNSDIGQIIRDHVAHLHRELPVYYANPSGTQISDPLDQQMVRGRIDLLVPAPGGWMIVDYKTDRVEGAALDDRVALYTRQLEIYRKAIQKITGKPVVESALVFLTPRQIRRV